MLRMTTFGEDDRLIGTGGLMAQFARYGKSSSHSLLFIGSNLMSIYSEMDDVRQVTSLSSGYLLQYLITTTTCLILAFICAPLVTLVILSVVPLLIPIQGHSQAFASPHMDCSGCNCRRSLYFCNSDGEGVPCTSV